ncbi:NlpC/P60 family protein [Nocardia sp. NBC_00565]|uniref:NlpC/P60 family protein n=1 Tax=Nocardia sp. NBC_00565 TaxID=2975993 RepID=UPI002E8214FE|nr:NlpC/P60 family protein [Nocardia sp. NBC_00565]WUC07015.1 NlpC/P60 family protein [Nocardia sp. NBC_00565]
MRNNGVAGSRRPLWVALGLLVTAAVLVTAGPVAAVPPAPPNPSDGQIADAGAQVDARVSEVGALINQVAAADQKLQELDAAIAQKREEVNKALVDLQDARDAADVAAAAVVDSQRELADAATQVEQARRNFDQFVIQAYTRPAATSMVTYLSSATPDVALDRAQVFTLVSKNQRSVLDSLRRAQIDQGNKNSIARRAKSLADAAAAEAEQKKADAEHAVAAVKAEQDQQAAEREGLLRERTSAQGRLDIARTNVAGLQGQREAYLAWDQQRKAEEAAVRAAAAAAAARAAQDQAAKDRAAQTGAGKRPHVQMEDSPPPRQTRPRTTTPSMPSIGGSDAVETVVDRAMSQLGVIYAWGGGDEDGPTLGIHDGGVADSYGDYDKVGFDCSGLMIYAFAGIGVSLPHYSGYQYNAGTRVPVGERTRGDMLFWGPNGSEHVALYLGNGKMVEAPQSGEVVRVSPVREGGIMPYAVRIVS